MAESVHLFLTIDNKRILGDSSQHSLGRADSIECLEVRDALSTAARDGVAVELRLVKRPDRSSVSLAQALIDRSPLAGELRYYRPSPDGDGTTQHYLTTRFDGGRIVGLARTSPSVVRPDTAIQPVTEELVLSVGEITWTWTSGGAQATARVR